MMKNTDPLSLTAGERFVEMLREENFAGYLRRPYEDFLRAIDSNVYSFEDLGVSEVEVLDLMLVHLEKDYEALNFPFFLGSLRTKLIERREKAYGAGRPPVWAPPVLIHSQAEVPVSKAAA